MSKVRSKNNKSTELKLRAYLIRYGISGWRTNARDVVGKPDVVFDKKRLAIFVDGCFWHGCPKCYRRPKSKRKFWDNKIVENKTRGSRVSRLLRKQGWTILRFYECELANKPESVLNRIFGYLD
jgi:DNA mismatch endonuclease (patch repair protein)